MKKIFYLGLSVLLIFSCSPLPSVHKIQQSFENRELNIQTGLIKIISFQKVNAQKGVKEGIKFYRVEYEAQIEFLKKVWEIDPEKYNKIMMEAEHAEFMPTGFLVLWPDSLNQNGYYSEIGIFHNEHETKRINGVLLFEMTEKGWQITNMSVLSE
ncbi:MAG: hypothetical protein MUO85_00210 [candidate division Zixibacteria bacterium]|nr:hypothetical protein [candidate division Zixibacteria bacterium]